MESAGALLRELRKQCGLSQRALAARAGTSAATVALYETGRKEPRLSTLARLAEAAGVELDVALRPLLTINERRSLELGRSVAAKYRDDPERVRRVAERNLERWRRRHGDPATARYWDEWQRRLDDGNESVIEALTSSSQQARDLRQANPFAGVLSDEERLGAFARAEQR